MKSFSFLILPTFFFQVAHAQNADVETLKKLNQQWIDAYVSHDTSAVSDFFAADFVLINPRGAKINRGQALSGFLNPDIISTHIEEVEVRLLTENVAIITAKTTFQTKNAGNIQTGTSCYQDIYKKVAGRWYAEAAHVTLLDVK